MYNLSNKLKKETLYGKQCATVCFHQNYKQIQKYYHCLEATPS